MKNKTKSMDGKKMCSLPKEVPKRECATCPSNNGYGEPNWSSFTCYQCSDAEVS